MRVRVRARWRRLGSQLRDAKSDRTHKCRLTLALALAILAVHMADRQELVRSAVAFLTDPKVFGNFVSC